MKLINLNKFINDKDFYLDNKNILYDKLLNNIKLISINFTKSHKVIVCTDKKKLTIFINNCILFYLDNFYNIFKSFIGLDFEFNNIKIDGKSKSVIALHQIALYYDDSYYIYIIDPSLLSDEYLNIYINTIYLSHIHRIVHGSDSLDIPYIFEYLFHNNSNKIIQFTMEMIDTRYLCEYYKIVIKTTNMKCSIYDGLLYFNTITNDIYNFLNSNMDKIHYNRTDEWNIFKLSDNHIKYTAYDVIYLKDFLNNIIIEANKDIKFSSIHLIPSITRFIYFIKWGIYDKYVEGPTYNNIKLINDNINNEFIKQKKKNITLLTIYNNYIEKCYLNDLHLSIKDILSINYFKSVITNFTKYLIYGEIKKKYTVYISTDIKSNIILDNNLVLQDIFKLNIKKISQFFNSFNNDIIINIKRHSSQSG